MDKSLIETNLKSMVGSGNVWVDEPMKSHTSFRVGGPADFLVTPHSVEELGGVLNFSRKENVPCLVMGNGTNLIVRDKGIKGIVVKTFGNMDKFSVYGEIIEAEAGILLSRLSNIALENGLAGLEFASGIPGTLGGAVAMNAGAYTGEMKDVVVESEYMDSDGNLKKVQGDQHGFGYRTSFIQKSGGILLKSRLNLKKGSRADIKALMDDFGKRRRDKQPLEFPSAGSIFKRPEGYFAGKLIEDCGLKGYKLGGAEVSPKHCGFIVNTGNAQASDIINLIKHIQMTVKAKFGVDLQTEVRIVGDE